jgi:hypothetical protein
MPREAQPTWQPSVFGAPSLRPPTQLCVAPPNASITVVITDECKQCGPYEINLHAFAFEQLARLKYGSANIQYRQVWGQRCMQQPTHMEGPPTSSSTQISAETHAYQPQRPRRVQAEWFEGNARPTQISKSAMVASAYKHSPVRLHRRLSAHPPTTSPSVWMPSAWLKAAGCG